MVLLMEELKKLWKLFAADPKPVAAGLIAPTMILIVFWLIFGNLTSLPIIIINNDTGVYGEKLKSEILSQVSPLGNVPYFSQVKFKQEDHNKKVSSLAESNKMFLKGAVAAIIVIPKDFSSSCEAVKSEEIRIAGNKTAGGDARPEIDFTLNNFNSDFAKNLRLYLQEGILSFYKHNYPEMNVKVREELPPGGMIQWVEIIATGSILLAAIIGGMYLYLFLFFKEKQYGTLLFYRISPFAPAPSFVARYIFSLLFSTAAASVNMLFAWLLTGRNFFISFHILIPVLLLTALCYISVSAVISLLSDNFFSSTMIVMVGAIFGWFIAGGLNSVQTGKLNLNGIIAAVLPNMYALNIIRNKTLGLPVQNTAFNYLLLLCMALILTAFSYLLLYLKLYRGRNSTIF
ncbi:MAG: ABC transporter permease [Spirochaetes bacterium]|nr:ABC transporter permease [Spirochaetota bacterium]